MGIEMKFVTFFVVLAVFVLVQETYAATYVVGDSLGWIIPRGGAADYATWASKNTYAPGDILVFNYAAGVHDVATVTKASYDSCSSNSPLSLQTVSPSSVTLTTAGTYYFICTFGTHCSSGQKLTISVTTSSAPPTAATSPPTAATSPPTASTSPPTAATSPPTASTSPPTAATSPPTSGSITPTGATSPPTAVAMPPSTTVGAPVPSPGAATMPPTTAAPTPVPTAAAPAPEGGVPVPGPATGPGESPPGAAPGSTGDSASPPSPSAASREAVATLGIGVVLVVMGVVF